MNLPVENTKSATVLIDWPCPSVSPLLVAYDISDSRRRNRLHRLLRGFGEPLHNSVFVCWVDGPRSRRLASLIEDFARASHKGNERIDIVPTRSGGLNGLLPPDHWVFE